MPTRGDEPTAGPMARRWRLDDRTPKLPIELPPLPRASGRRIVLAIVAAFLVLWLGLSLSFRQWKARYQARAEFGAPRSPRSSTRSPRKRRPASPRPTGEAPSPTPTPCSWR